MAGSAGAQTKIGYISIDNMVGVMPETAKIDSLLEQYQSDSINPQYAQIVSAVPIQRQCVQGFSKTSTRCRKKAN